MNKPEHFEIMEDHAVFRPSGQVSLEQAVQLITSALVYAREQHIKKLLVVTTGLTGFEPPNLCNALLFHSTIGPTPRRGRFALRWSPDRR